jgi:hypothetical protein
MKGEKILAFFKIAGPSLGLGAFAQKTWDEHKNNKVDVDLKILGVDHSKFDLTEKQHNLAEKQHNFKIKSIQDQIKIYHENQDLFDQNQKIQTKELASNYMINELFPNHIPQTDLKDIKLVAEDSYHSNTDEN